MEWRNKTTDIAIKSLTKVHKNLEKMREKILKPTMEIKYAEELEALRATDTGKKPENWLMSPKAVKTFILGSNNPIEHMDKKVKITKKFFGDDALVERSIITLAGNRGLMLIGDPGTAKTMLDEIQASYMVKGLAEICKKKESGVFELIDGIKSSFIKGETASYSHEILKILYRLLTEMEVGKVDENSEIPPIVNDF